MREGLTAEELTRLADEALAAGDKPRCIDLITRLYDYYSVSQRGRGKGQGNGMTHPAQVKH